MPIKCDEQDKFFEILANNRLYIYGVGYVANLFWDALERNKLFHNVESFVVSDVKETRYMHGKPVKGIEEIRVTDNSVVCIAVHETLRFEIESILLKHKINNYIWIYPFLYDFSLKNVKSEEKWIDTYMFKNIFQEQYGIALRWVAINEYYGNCVNGYNLYYKGLLTYCESKTAKLRMERFKKLISNWEKNGYQPQYEIYINKDYQIIDGEHRFTLALYHGVKKIKCKVYEGVNIHQNRSTMTYDILMNHEFTLGELEQLTLVNKIILKKMEEA